MHPQEQENIISAIERFKKKKILVVGDLMLDLYIEGRPRTISQEAPVIVLQAEKKFYKLGGSANSAENIKALGGKAYAAGVIGDHNLHHDFGRSFLQTIRKSRIPMDGIIIDHSRPTTLKMRIVAQNQQIVRVDEEAREKINRKIEDKLIKYINKILPVVDAVLVSDYNKGVITERLMENLREKANKFKKKIIVDPKPQNKKLYREVYFITPNDIELSGMFGGSEVEEEKLIKFGKKLRKDLRIDNVLLTRGSKGMDLINGNANIRHIPALAKKAIDVSGAGDTVAAIIALGANDLDPNDVSFLSAIAAKISVEKFGTATVSVSELREEIKKLEL